MKPVTTALFVVSLIAIAQSARAEFRENGDGTVTDLRTQLMWQRCTAPAEGSLCESGLPALYAWNDALAYCNALVLGGHSDWRLPNVKVLHSVVDVTRTVSPVIDTTAFPASEAQAYWSSTTLDGTPGSAWYVSFGYGHTSANSKGAEQYVRCVRGQ